MSDAATDRRESPATGGYGAALGGLLALLWLFLWKAGWPLPNGDDGFFAGAGINLARTGHLANPWISGWMHYIDGAHTDRFFIHPPFFPYAMALWLKIFGISASSLTGFACAAGATAAWAIARLLRLLGAGWPAAAAGSLMVSAYALSRGLRPETLGLALFLVGQGLMLDTGRARWTAGCLLTLASPGFHAIFAVMAAPALLLQFWILGRAAEAARDFRPLRTRLALSLLAAAVLLLAFTLAIGAEFTGFIHDFLGHARLVTPHEGQKFARFIKEMTLGWEIVPNGLALATAVVTVAGACASSPALRSRIGPGLAAFSLMVCLGIGLYAQFSVSHVILAAAFIALASTARVGGFWRTALAAPAVVLVAWGCLQNGLQYWANSRAARPSEWRAARSYVEAARPDIVLFDASTLRYVFDFRPPGNSADRAWAWAPGLAERWWSPAALGERDVWVVNSDKLMGTAQAGLRPAPPRILGRSFPSVRISNGLAVIAGPGLPGPEAGSFLFLRSTSFRFPDQLH